MSAAGRGPAPLSGADPSLSLYRLLEPETRARPYPLYQRLREQDPVHWDPYLHAWIVTRYDDVVTVLQRCSAARSPQAEHLNALGLESLDPIARVMVRQMLFMDPPGHTRLRTLAAAAFTPARVQALRNHIQEITDTLIDRVLPTGGMDVIADLANRLPAMVTAEMMGVPVADCDRLKKLSTDFSEMLGNFQHNPGRTARMLEVVQALTSYFRSRMREQEREPKAGVVHALMTAEVNGERLTEEEVIANAIITMTGGQETTTNLIGNGLLALLQNPEQLALLRSDASLLPTAIEELLRFDSPIQYTTRLAPDDFELGGRTMGKRQAVLAVIGAANRDPAQFNEPDRLDITRRENRHLAFGWANHYCFGAPLARLEGQIAVSSILRRLQDLTLEPEPQVWRANMIFRGLEELRVRFRPNV
jgi:cytochrome P450